MLATPSDQTERLVQFSRRQLWWVLGFLLLLGAAWLFDLLADVRMPPALGAAIGIAIAIGAAVARPPSTEGIDFSPSNPALQALRNDELRQFAQGRAFRNGFFVLLAYPPLCAFALTGLGVADPLPAVVESGAWLGAVTFLASLLWHDR